MKVKLFIDRRIINSILQSVFFMKLGDNLILESLVLAPLYQKHVLKLKHSTENLMRINLKPSEAVALLRICDLEDSEYLKIVAIDIQRQLGAQGIQIPVTFPETII